MLKCIHVGHSFFLLVTLKNRKSFAVYYVKEGPKVDSTTLSNHNMRHALKLKRQMNQTMLQVCVLSCARNNMLMH